MNFLVNNHPFQKVLGEKIGNGMEEVEMEEKEGNVDMKCDGMNVIVFKSKFRLFVCNKKSQWISFFFLFDFYFFLQKTGRKKFLPV